MHTDSMTVGEFKKHLEAYPDDFIIDFGCLEFYRLKQRGENMVNVEFSQSVYQEPDGTWVVQSPPK